MRWVAAYGKTATCCQKATDEQIAATPDRFDCATCELRTRYDDLWIANAEAWRIYTILCGTSIQRLEVQSQALEWVTAGWSASERLDLLTRLGWILDVLDPDSTANGRSPAQN